MDMPNVFAGLDGEEGFYIDGLNFADDCVELECVAFI